MIRIENGSNNTALCYFEKKKDVLIITFIVYCELYLCMGECFRKAVLIHLKNQSPSFLNQLVKVSTAKVYKEYQSCS